MPRKTAVQSWAITIKHRNGLKFVEFLLICCWDRRKESKTLTSHTFFDECNSVSETRVALWMITCRWLSAPHDTADIMRIDCYFVAKSFALFFKQLFTSEFKYLLRCKGVTLCQFIRWVPPDHRRLAWERWPSQSEWNKDSIVIPPKF